MRTLVVLLAAAFLLAGCSDSGSSDDDSPDDGNMTSPPPPPPGATGPQTHMVSMANNAFEPRVMNITVGDEVLWTHNDGTTPHNVESNDPSFDSNPQCTAPVPGSPLCMTDGDTYPYTFEEVGDVEYRCEVHPSMTGTLHVLAEATDHSMHNT